AAGSQSGDPATGFRGTGSCRRRGKLASSIPRLLTSVSRLAAPALASCPNGDCLRCASEGDSRSPPPALALAAPPKTGRPALRSKHVVASCRALPGREESREDRGRLLPLLRFPL